VGTRSQFEDAERITFGTAAAFAPLGELHGTVTPAALHYVVNHGGVATIDPARQTLLIHGMVARPTVFTLE
jgi:sulfane dehydrogenase subunit SoxC